MTSGPESRYSEKLRRLFETVPRDPDTRQMWSSAALAAEVTRRGVPTGQSHIAHLRAGTRTNPSAALVKAIAEAFDVDVAYFFDDTSSTDWNNELEATAALRSAGVRGVALRASGLSPAGLARLAELADLIRGVEGLPAAGQGPQPDDKSNTASMD